MGDMGSDSNSFAVSKINDLENVYDDHWNRGDEVEFWNDLGRNSMYEGHVQNSSKLENDDQRQLMDMTNMITAIGVKDNAINVGRNYTKEETGRVVHTLNSDVTLSITEGEIKEKQEEKVKSDHMLFPHLEGRQRVDFRICQEPTVSKLLFFHEESRVFGYLECCNEPNNTWSSIGDVDTRVGPMTHISEGAAHVSLKRATTLCVPTLSDQNLSQDKVQACENNFDFNGSKTRAAFDDRKGQFQAKRDCRGSGDMAKRLQGCNGEMYLISVESINPREMEGRTSQWRGDSSKITRRKKYKRFYSNGTQLLPIKSRSISPNRSCSINDSSIYNCNRRVKDYISERVEAELWKIASDLGVECALGEERVIHRLGELEHRDTKLLRTLTCEGRQGSL